MQRVTDSLNEAVNEGDIYLEKSYNTAYLYLEEEDDTIECRWDESGTYTFPKVEGYNTMEVYCPGGPGDSNLRLYKKVNGENIPVLFMGWLLEYDEAFPGTEIYLFGDPGLNGYGIYDAIKGEWIRDFEGPHEYWPFNSIYTLDINDYFADSDQMVLEKSSTLDSVRIIDPNNFVIIPHEIVSNTLVKRQYPVNADWSEEDQGSLSYIINKPIIPPAQFQEHPPYYDEVEGDIRIQEDETEYIDYENGGVPTKDGFLITIDDEMNTDVKVYQAVPTQVNYGTEEDPDYGTEYEKGTLILRGRMYFDDLLDGQYVHGFYFTDKNGHIVIAETRPSGQKYIPYTAIFGNDPITAIIAEGTDFDLMCCSPTGGFVEKFGNDFYVRKPYPGKTDEVNALNDNPVSSRGVFNEIHWPVTICQNNDTLRWNSYYDVQTTNRYLESDLTLKIEDPDPFRGRNNKIILNLHIDTSHYTPTLSFTTVLGVPIHYWKDGKSPSSITQSGFYTIVFELRALYDSTAQIVGSIEEWIHVS